MVTPAAGTVILVPFPFSDLSQAKLRPAVVLADVGRGDWILCQITSNPYGDARAILLTDASFAVGALRVTRYARPGKLFTAHHTLMVSQVGTLKAEPLRQIIEAVVVMQHTSLRPQWGALFLWGGSAGIGGESRMRCRPVGESLGRAIA